MVARPIHPFPARMAPDIALSRCRDLPATAVVLDPMVGSGTVLRAAVEAGLRGVGFDVDPLSVLMTRVWTTPIDARLVREAGQDLVARARSLSAEVHLPWIDDDPETSAFVDYWFAAAQQRDLRRVSALLRDIGGPVGDALCIVLSRLIVTKDHGASLARDVSHSRPHRVSLANDFDVLSGFLWAMENLASRLLDTDVPAVADVALGDARRMHTLGAGMVDAIITSPPYLNAIDYLRGHRLSLVWLGYQIGELRAIRAASVGAERAPDRAVDPTTLAALAPTLGRVDLLPSRVRGMIERYLLDLLSFMGEFRRVLRPGGTTTLVIGNSCLRGVQLDNAAAITAVAHLVGLQLVDRMERELPASRRYLPPPQASPLPDEPRRMRTEVVITFQG
jgi:hypothetical protein